MISIANGAENFADIRQKNAYYVDKSKFIEKLIQDGSKVTLITRPRRFGKTLTQSMLAHFFDITRDSRAEFAGLKISANKELCEAWQNRYPVLLISLKEVVGYDYETAYEQLVELIADFCLEKDFVLESTKLSDEDKALFKKFRMKTSSKAEITNSLFSLTRLLNKHFGKEPILLIDEYDVPLAKAAENGYYPQMMDLMRGLLGKALKTNDNLQLAVLTGCLRVSKESIFTGLNNLTVDSITGDYFDEYLGFTPAEVTQLLQAAGLADHAEEMKQWYDGYRFGKAEVYCPWDVMNHVRALLHNPTAEPQNYWGNTSGNGVIHTFIEKGSLDVKRKFETLLAGGYIKTTVKEDLTYDTIESTAEDFWSLLFMTGYLTKADAPDERLLRGELCLRIPNSEVKEVFERSIVAWFKAKVTKMNVTPIFEALWQSEAGVATELITDLLFGTISYHDYQESYYHAFMTGLFAGGGYDAESNAEMGKGRADMVIRDESRRGAMIFEFKYTKDHTELEQKCTEALQKIKEREYAKGIERGYRTILCYGVAFCGKECLVKKLAD